MLKLRCVASSGTSRSSARGLSMIELMVGVAVGMVVVGGAVGIFVSNLSSSRQLLAETRLNQDLRAAADLVARDLRRANYWGDAVQGTIAIGAGTAVAQNPYGDATTASGSDLAYRYSRDELTGGVENNAVDGHDRATMRLSGGAIEMRAGNDDWVAITDSTSVTITAFAVTPTLTTIPLGNFCPTSCAPGALNCPTITVRSYAILLQGKSVKDAALQRSLRSDVRLRNDRLAGQCPP